MVAGREDLKTVEADWAAFAAVRGYRCALCGTVPPHAERAVFFARDLCEWCAKAVDKDDLANARII
jgi:hypothetical protein